MRTHILTMTLTALSLVSFSSNAWADAPPALNQNANTATASIPHPPSQATVDAFLQDANLLSLADDYGTEPLLFLRQGDSKFRKAFAPSVYASSWQMPVDAGPVILIQGRLYARDFYRMTAYSRVGSRMIDDRDPHVIGAEQWSIDTTQGKFTLELQISKNNDGTTTKKGAGTSHLIDMLLQSIPGDSITLYRGVHHSEGKFYADVKALSQQGKADAMKNTIVSWLKNATFKSGAGTFTTPTKAAAIEFATASEDPNGALVVYKIDKKKLAAFRSGIYVGVESDYFEIAFSAPEARALLLSSIYKVCTTQELKKSSACAD